MAARLSITATALTVSFDDEDKAAHRITGPFLIGVLKATRVGNDYTLSQGEFSRHLEPILVFLNKQNFEVHLDDATNRVLADLDRSRRAFEEARSTSTEPAARIETLPARRLTSEQVDSVHHLLCVQNGANFSVPGAGKTTITYAAFKYLVEQDVADKLLVIAPRAAFLPWEEEFAACFGRAPRSARLTGTPQHRNRIYDHATDYELIIGTYQTATNDIARLKALCRLHRVVLVLDESHYIKRIEEGQWAQAMLELAPYATRRFVLSGTPMPQGYDDLWTQFTFLWPSREVLGEKFAYRRRIERGETAQISADVRPFFRRITKRDLDLPPLNVERLAVTLSPEQRRIYTAIEEHVIRDSRLAPIDRTLLRQWRRVRMVRLLQAASNPALLSEYSEEFALEPEDASDRSIIEVARRYGDFETPVKFVEARRILVDLLEADRKVVVWTSFVKNIRMFMALVGDEVPVFTVYGAVPRDPSEDIEFNREQQISAFKSTAGAAVLVANPAACGESISLHQACKDAIYIDRTFDCAKYIQSQDRIHRLGLGPDDHVTARIIVASDTIDEVIDGRLDDKMERMRSLLEDELPTGSFSDVDEAESEEAADFEATIESIQSHRSARTAYQ